ncbi:hypothetical protein ACOMHN_060446 [Nucella lapillus]
MFAGSGCKMEQKVVWLLLVLLGLTTVWGQMEIPCSMPCESGGLSGSSPPTTKASNNNNNNNNNNNHLCCPAGFTRTIVPGNCACSIPLPSFLGADGKPNLSGLTASQLTRYQFQLLDYIQRLTSVVPLYQEKSAQSPEFILSSLR